MKKNYGYVVVDLNLERDTGKIVIGRLKKTGANRERKAKTAIEIGPFKKGRYFFLFALPEDNYVWTEISVPHYDLPHVVDQLQDERWSFSVQANYLNYAGQIRVNEERSSRRISLGLINRLAASLNELRSAYPEQFRQYPLRSAGIYRDLFVEKYMTKADPQQ